MTRQYKDYKVLLMQPNFSLLGKRSWKLIPYGLCLLKAVCNDDFDVTVYDPNFKNESEAEIKQKLIDLSPAVVGLTSFSTEYVEEVEYHARLVKNTLPGCQVILGGVLPTVWLEKVISCPDIDCFVSGEGENVLGELLKAIIDGDVDSLQSIKGVAYINNGHQYINKRPKFITDLDALPLPDYSDLDVKQYGDYLHRFAHTCIPRQFPFVTIMTSRGCPFSCTFCAAHTVSGKKVRLRSAENVLKEIAYLHNTYGIREIIFLDDHFLFNRQRAIDIMTQIHERFPEMTWKCGNIAVFSLDEEILKLMMETGCNQLTISVESGNDYVLKHLIKKPVNLNEVITTVEIAKKLGFEVISNFVIGTPGETWEQIRETFSFAEKLSIDMVNFHIATPLPKTELMQMCLDAGLLNPENDNTGYTVGKISTNEFDAAELQILRAFEWDRINFPNRSCNKRIAKLQGLSENEVAEWRKLTRRTLGVTNKHLDKK